MYTSMQLYFTWFMYQSLLIVMIILSTSLYLKFNKPCITRQRLIAAFLIIAVLSYELIFVYPSTFVAGIYMFSRMLFVVVLIFSRVEYLRSFLKLVVHVTAFLILISLVFWVLFLLGVPLPHYSTLTNNYYEHTVYYFFILNGDAGQLIPRFAGLFLEPGHLGSMASMLLFLNGVSLRKWQNIVFLIATILSLSLAAYGLLVGGIVLYLITKSKRGYLKIIPYIVGLAGLVVFFTEYNGGDNPVNEKILSRLVFEDGEIAGNNRTSQWFDMQYDKYLESPNTVLGIGREAYNEVLIGTASWKRYFFVRGYVGCILLLVFLFYYLKIFPSKTGGAFLIIYIVCNMIRDYPLDELWLYLVIAFLPVCRYEYDKLLLRK